MTFGEVIDGSFRLSDVEFHPGEADCGARIRLRGGTGLLADPRSPELKGYLTTAAQVCSVPEHLWIR